MPLLYRFLTGPDDSSFCHKISNALNDGWELYGNPCYVTDPNSGKLQCGQAVTKTASKEYDPDKSLGDQ